MINTYDLDLENVVKTIKREKAKKVLLQFPDGLKPFSGDVADKIEFETGCVCVIWAGTCFGVCDLPDVKGFDLLVHFGHNEFGFEKIVK